MSINHATLNLELAEINVVQAMTNPNKAAEQIVFALKEVGFLHLVNIPDFIPEELLEAAHWFFGLQLETKMVVAKRVFRKENVNQYRGYFPLIHGGNSYKEVFEIGSNFSKGEYPSQRINGRPVMKELLLERNTWPKTDSESDDKRFEEILTRQYHVYKRTGKFIMGLIARGLGLEDSFFEEMFRDPNISTLRLIHYPIRRFNVEIPDEGRDADTVITTGAHADSAMVTLLATFHNPGLQVLYKEIWHNIPPRMDSLVMNIGALLEEIVGGQLKATIHRVIDLGEDRYSAPFFYEGRVDADISRRIDGKPIESLRDKPHLHHYGAWMSNRTSQFAEYRATDFGVYP